MTLTNGGFPDVCSVYLPIPPFTEDLKCVFFIVDSHGMGVVVPESDRKLFPNMILIVMLAGFNKGSM